MLISLSNVDDLWLPRIVKTFLLVFSLEIIVVYVTYLIFRSNKMVINSNGIKYKDNNESKLLLGI